VPVPPANRTAASTDLADFRAASALVSRHSLDSPPRASPYRGDDHLVAGELLDVAILLDAGDLVVDVRDLQAEAGQGVVHDLGGLQGLPAGTRLVRRDSPLAAATRPDQPTPLTTRPSREHDPRSSQDPQDHR